MPRSPSTGPILTFLAAAALIGTGVYLLNDDRKQDAIAQDEPSVESFASDENRQRPSLEGLNRAIELGTQAYLRNYAQTSLDAVSNGGWVDYINPQGKKERHGPNAYVACQLYLLTHLLMYDEEFRLSADTPLLMETEAWFLDQFDEEKGRWLWSEEGCLHPKGMIALARHGHLEQVDKAWVWAKQSLLWLPEHQMFTMRQSGDIIQTLGSASLSLSGKSDWDHGSPIPDAESSAKFLYAMLLAGHSPDEPEIAELNEGLNYFFEQHPLKFAEMGTEDIVGMVWYIFCHNQFDLPKQGGYEFSVNTLTESMETFGLIQKHPVTKHFTALRGLIVKALLMANLHPPAIDSQIQRMIDKQDESGAWPLTAVAKRAWGFDKKPVVGIKMGQMDGANTYLTALALIAYRDMVYGKQEPSANDSPAPGTGTP